MPGIKQIPFQVLIAFDQLLNTMCGGWADETFSARCYRLQDRSKGWKRTRKIVDTILFFDEDHCKSSYESEIVRTHLPPSMRK